MNRFIGLLLLLSSCISQAQPSAADNEKSTTAADTIDVFNGEFNVYQNGLIYSPHTVNQLTHIVDSLNIKFKRCDLSRPFLSMRQGMGYHVTINKTKARAAAKDMAAGISLQELMNKYGSAVTLDSLHIVISRYTDYKDEIIWQFEGLGFKDYGNVEINKKGNTDYNKASLVNSWVAEEVSKDYDLEAIYFKQEPTATAIPETYARMILYTECVIDTTTDIYIGKKNTGVFGGSNPTWDKGYKKTKLFAFNDYIEKNTAQITAAQLPKSYKDYSEYHGVDSMRKAWVRNTLSKQPEFKTKLGAAVAEFNGGDIGTEEEFEYYVANYYSKKMALDMKRKRRVVGMCSQDNSPRQHAQQIAMLSAEAVNWETFLRAHLNIMNDRFERASDGSYAWAGRQTYIKELEALNIDVNDLLIGISLRTSNAAEKHYYGSISRMGRAFAETKDKEVLVKTLLSAIANQQLDAYNRVLMFYVLNHYAYNLKEKAERLQAFDHLLQAKKSLPEYIGRKIVVEKKDYE